MVILYVWRGRRDKERRKERDENGRRIGMENKSGSEEEGMGGM